MAEEPVRILATGVFATALRSLAQPFEAASGTKIEISIANAGEVAARHLPPASRRSPNRAR
jgi:hypothetical protein